MMKSLNPRPINEDKDLELSCPDVLRRIFHKPPSEIALNTAYEIMVLCVDTLATVTITRPFNDL